MDPMSYDLFEGQWLLNVFGILSSMNYSPKFDGLIVKF